MIRSYGNKKPKIDESAFIFENTSIIGDVEIGKDCIIYPGAVLRCDVETCKIIVGDGAVIQDNCVVHASPKDGVTIGENANIGHAAIIHGCTIGDNTTIGMNAVIQNGAKIGEFSIIGAGAVVSQNMVVPPRHLAYGIPAKVVRELSDAEIKNAFLETPEHYAERLKVYKKDEEDNKFK
ncbi:MAG: gamma carbonic anhydrase family protein [Lachnospiraceae bacterium]|nr:gamma carbonic anhydrase family protein [Lachnospiraceae bacterium]